MTKSLTTVAIGRGFPRKTIITHRYVHTHQVTVGSNMSTSVHAYLANGMTQPSVFGVTHQPMWFDNMATVYDHYTVIGSKCRFKVTPLEPDHTATAFAAFIDDNNVMTSTSMSAIWEQNTGRFKTFPASSTDTWITLPLKFSAKKVFGGRPISDPSLQGTVLADPTEKQYFVVVGQNLDTSSTDFHQYSVTVEIEYIALWQEMREQPQS